MLALTPTPMCPALVLWCQLTLDPPGRHYHPVPLADLASTLWTHVEVEGLVVYVRHQDDGDWHVTITAGDAKAVVEIIPAIPLPPPPKGAFIQVHGISRFDRDHHWPEVHPAEQIVILRLLHPRLRAERPER